MSNVKIGIGTVQFGMDYGISNTQGKIPATEIRKILELAGREKIRLLDTAALYGQSEEILGQTLEQKHEFAIVTKTPKFDFNGDASTYADRLETVFRQSLRRLRQPHVYGLLIHRAADLLAREGESLYERMVSLRSRGLVTKIGASVYNAVEIEELLGRYQIDLMQVPVSILDQRLIRSGHLSALKKAGVEIHARSIFLQGLLLMSPDSLPERFSAIRERMRTYREVIARQGLTPLMAALAFVKSLPDLDIVICGVNNHLQLEEICQAVETTLEPDSYAGFAINDEALINPSRWNT